LDWRFNSSRPRQMHPEFMKRVILSGLLVAVFSISAVAQVLKPIDRRKQADVNNKSVNLPNVNLNTQSEPTRGLPSLPLSNVQPHLKDVKIKHVGLNTLDLSAVTMKTLPQQNFTAKRAVVSDRMHREAVVTTGNAPIKDRQIRAFTPAGEEELKKQFNTAR